MNKKFCAKFDANCKFGAQNFNSRLALLMAKLRSNLQSYAKWRLTDKELAKNVRKFAINIGNFSANDEIYADF